MPTIMYAAGIGHNARFPFCLPRDDDKLAVVYRRRHYFTQYILLFSSRYGMYL
jgi:hypothetical protein